MKKKEEESTGVSKKKIGGKMYPSDISDKEWAILEPYVAQWVIERPKKHNIRTVINPIKYILMGLSVENVAKRFSVMENGI